MEVYFVTGNENKAMEFESILGFKFKQVDEIQEISVEKVVEHKAIVKKLDRLAGETKKLEGIYRQKLADLEELKKSVLKKAFSGEL